VSACRVYSIAAWPARFRIGLPIRQGSGWRGRWMARPAAWPVAAWPDGGQIVKGLHIARICLWVRWWLDGASGLVRPAFFTVTR
jgi:hypothetical protein